MKTFSKNELPPGSVVLENVSKRFRKRTVRSYSTVKTSFIKRFFSRSSGSETYVEALRSADIHIRPGESLGIIGRNGSGKSTLLKLISGIYRADSGRIQIAGRVSALIELGAGFHPDFTGRENIYLGGVMYGMKRSEIDAKMGEIIAYAELEDFIDDPVRTYSSGMYMRLGFSLAIHTDPDILLVDEVLAVGDAAFIHRCQDTISELKSRGKTLIFVTHDLDSVVRWCDEALWLDRGEVKLRGGPREVVGAYLQEIEGEEEVALERDNEDREKQLEREEESESEVKRWGSREIEISDVRMLAEDGEERWLFHSEEKVTISIRYRFIRAVEDLVVGVGILRVDGLTVYGSNTDIDDIQVPFSSDSKEGICTFTIERLSLLENSYFLDVALHKSDGTPYDYHHRTYKFSVRNSKRSHGVFEPVHRWSFSETSRLKNLQYGS